MSYLSGSSNEDLWVMLGAMVAGGFVLQWQNQRLEADPGEIVAECADGSMIGGWRNRVRRRPGRRKEQRAQALSRFPYLKLRQRRALLTDDLRPGDLCFARVRRGREGEAGWIVDGLGQNRETTWITWEFDSEDVARRALNLVEKRIVREGVPVRVTEAEFDAVQARERLEAEQVEQQQQQDEAGANARA